MLVPLSITMAGGGTELTLGRRQGSPWTGLHVITGLVYFLNKSNIRPDPEAPLTWLGSFSQSGRGHVIAGVPANEHNTSWLKQHVISAKEWNGSEHLRDNWDSSLRRTSGSFSVDESLKVRPVGQSWSAMRFHLDHQMILESLKNVLILITVYAVFVWG